MTPAFRSTASRRAQPGFGIVELMVSLAIGMFLVIGFVAAMMNASANVRSNERTSDLQVGGRNALEELRRDIFHAGYRGFTWPDPAAAGLAAVTGDCAAGFSVNLRQGIWGANDSNPFSGTCIPAANYAGGDVLVVRRAGLTRATALAANTLYLRSAYERAQVFLGSAPPAFAETPAEDRPLEVSIYYVSPYSFSSSESPRIPGLFRITLGPGPQMGVPELIAPGVETLQLQFGRLATDGTTYYQNANAVSASATSITTDPSEWDDVNAVRVWLLVRSLTPEPGNVNSTSYVLGDRTLTVNDGYRRQVFSTTVQVRN